MIELGGSQTSLKEKHFHWTFQPDALVIFRAKVASVIFRALVETSEGCIPLSWSLENPLVPHVHCSIVSDVQCNQSSTTPLFVADFYYNSIVYKI